MARAVPERAEELRSTVRAALEKIVEQAPEDLADKIRNGQLARELERIAR